MAELLILAVVVFALTVWLNGNRFWAERTGLLSLIPLNLGLFWFIGFPIGGFLWTDVSLPLDNGWQAAGAVLIWLGPAWMLDQWFDRIMEAQRDADGQLRPRSNAPHRRG